MSKLTRFPKKFRIGTRASPLALKQADIVANALIKVHPELKERIEIQHFTTSGDKFVDRPLSDIGGKGLFTKELEVALIADDIDIAVHSMKDMATTLPDGLKIAAMLKRDDVRDKVIGPYTSLDELPKGATFGTSSLRRAAQLKILRPDLNIVPFRGNVQTRLKKLEAGEVTATMLAQAGLERLALDTPGFLLDASQFLPAVAQGAIGIECRSDNETANEILRTINHEPTTHCVQAERAFLKVLDGSCRTPIAGYAQLKEESIHISGLIAKPDGSAHHSAELTDNKESATETGIRLGEMLLAKSGKSFI